MVTKTKITLKMLNVNNKKFENLQWKEKLKNGKKNTIPVSSETHCISFVYVVTLLHISHICPESNMHIIKR